MRKSVFAKFTAILLALIMVVPQISVYAEEEKEEKSTMDEVIELLNTQSYKEYLSEHEILGWTDGESEITVDPTKDYVYTADEDYADEGHKAEVVKLEIDGVEKEVLRTPETGTVTWTITVPKNGLYILSFTYLPVESDTTNTSNIKRVFMVDGKLPFKEANYLELTRAYADEYKLDENGNRVFKTDKNGNEKRPTKNERFSWNTYTLSDSTGYNVEPLKIAFTEGEHTISLEAELNEMYIGEMKLTKYKATKTYAEYIAENDAKGATDVAIDSGYKDEYGNKYYTLQAEYPTATSDITIYPLNDRTSPISQPQDPALQKLNTIGSSKWQTVGQWIEWTIPADAIKTSGYYYIVPRFLQDTLQGLFASRRIYINGEVPFEEANYLQFNYSDEWQTVPLNNGKDNLKFYFEAGKEYTIKMEVVYGNMTDALSRCEAALSSMNDIYNSILRITGPSPDENMDYGFAEQIYDTILLMRSVEEELNAIIKSFKEISGGSGADIATLEKVSYILGKMSRKESEIAKNLDNLKVNSGTLGTWIMETKMQALTIDYLALVPATATDKDMPKAKASFFESAGFEISAFFQSFVTDYNSLGSEDDENDTTEAVEVWIATSRDEAQVMRELIDNSCPVKVELKLVTAGTLLPATLAGMGPDISLATGQSDVINYAIRNAIEPLSQFDDYMSTVEARFNPETLVGLKLQNPETGEYDYYGMPERLSFLMMFYRKDIFAEFEIDIPETWDDLDAIVPDLQSKYRKVGMATSTSGLQIFMYQAGEELYRDEDGDGEPDGMRINIDSNTSLDCFETLCDLFTTYKFPKTYDLATYFRMGEMPIAIADYLTYNQFTIYATEIKGLWEFVPLPGTIRTNEDGTTYIDRSSPATVSATVIMADESRSDELRNNCWEFIKWWTDAPAQSEYARQYEAIIGLAAKYNTANTEALKSMSWTNSERKNLEAGFATIKGTPEFPGSYIITRYVDFAFNDVYNNGTNPVDALLNYVNQINAELTRKRQEFGLETYEEYLQRTSSN